MKWILSILVVFFYSPIHSDDILEYKIIDSYWNIKSNTLDVVVCAEPFVIDDMFAHYEDIMFTMPKKNDTTFELAGVSKGLYQISERKASIPRKILIAIDQGLNNSTEQLMSEYKQLAAEIVSKHPLDYVFDIVLISNNLTEIKRSTKFDLTHTINDLRNYIQLDEPTNFYRLFRSIDIQKYKKFFILTNGRTENLLNKDNSLFNLIDRQQIGNTQIIPVSNEEDINTSLFSHLDQINTISSRRPNYSYIPEGGMPKAFNAFDNKTLLIKYQQTIDEPIKNNNYSLNIGFQKFDNTVSKEAHRQLAPFARPIINTQISSLGTSLKNCILTGSLLGLILYFFIPLYNRISFKRNHVFSYSEIQEEGISCTDPLKMSKINGTDLVVKYGANIMLLESWKYLKKNMSNPKYAKEYRHFFVNSVEDNLFNQSTNPFKYILPIWLAAIFSMISSLMYLVFVQNLFNDWTAFEISTILSHNITFPIPLMSNIITVLAIITTSILLLEFLNWSKTRSVKLNSIISTLSIGIVAILIMMSFFYFGMINELLLSFSKWIFIAGIAIVATGIFIIHYKPNINTAIQIFIALFFVSYVVFMLLPELLLSSYLSEELSYQISNFLYLSIIGSLYVNLQPQKQSPLGVKIISPPDIDEDIYHLEQHFLNEIKNDFTIGNDPDSDLHIKWLDVDVKARHAIIYRIDGQYLIEPCDGSVYINKTEIHSKTIISENDEIQLGEDSISQFTIINLEF